MTYYGIDLHPLITAAPYIGAGALIVGTEYMVRRVRRWANKPRIYDGHREGDF